jgi:hypothetical protein
MKGILSFFSQLNGGADRMFAGLLAEQLHAAVEGVQLAKRMTEGVITPSQARVAIRQAEHTGDDARQRLINELGMAFVTSVDREDLFRFSRSVDDILDGLRDFVREFDLYGMNPNAPCRHMLDAIHEGAQELSHAISDPGRGLAGLSAAARRAKKASNQVRRCYQQEMSHLVTQDFGEQSFKLRELLLRLDWVGLHLGEASDAWADAAMKRNR